MFTLKAENCVPFELTEDEYNFVVGQLRARQTADLKKSMEKYMDAFGVAALREIVKIVTNERK